MKPETSASDPVIGYFDPNPPTNNIRVICGDCLARLRRPETTKYQTVRVYRSNIEPYGQTCHECGKILVEARNDRWPELFEKTCHECGKTV